MSTKISSLIPHLSFSLGDEVNLNDWISDSINCDRSTAYRKVHGVSKLTCEELFEIIENSPGAAAINFPLFERENFSIIQSFQIKTEDDLWFYLLEFDALLDHQKRNKGNLKCKGARLPFFIFYCSELLFRYYRYQVLGIPISASLDYKFLRKIESIRKYVTSMPVFIMGLELRYEREIFNFHSLLTDDIIDQDMNFSLGKELSLILKKFTSTSNMNAKIGTPSKNDMFEEVFFDNKYNGIIIQKQANSHFIHTSHSDFKDMFMQKWSLKAIPNKK